MNKLKLFISNFLIYGLGSIAGKLIPFIMLPVITRLMPEAKYFGLNELVVTFVSFGSAIAILGMYDAVFRMFFDDDSEDFKKRVCSTALCFTLFTSVIIFLAIILFKDYLAIAVYGSTEYEVLVYIAAISVLIGSTNSILGIPTRAQNQSKVFVTLNIVTAIVSYSLSIPLLLKGYYLVAVPFAGVLAVLTNGAVFWYLNRRWFDFKLFEYDKLKEMLKIAVPLLPIFLIYWVFSSCDRLVISKVLGNDQVGIYSIGAKVASVSQLIYAAFAGGWQYFAFSTMKDEKQVENNSKVYEYLGIISFVALAFVCALCKTFFEIAFTGDYVQGYKVMPMLFLGPLLLMLYQVAGNQFLVIKKTWPSIFILLSGAIFNILFNYTYVPILGIEGAALANVGGYTVTNIICGIVLLKMKLIVIKLRFVFMAILCFAGMGIWMFYTYDSLLYGLPIAFLYSAISAYMYRSDLNNLYKMALKKR